jgi:hypothetical protein
MWCKRDWTLVNECDCVSNNNYQRESRGADDRPPVFGPRESLLEWPQIRAQSRALTASTACNRSVA